MPALRAPLPVAHPSILGNNNVDVPLSDVQQDLGTS